MFSASTIKTIAFDADDTLWVNESHYNEVEHNLVQLLSAYAPGDVVSTQLYETEKGNLPYFGYGAKSFMLSMIETAIELSQGEIKAGEIQAIINLGKGMLARPIQLLDGVPHVLNSLEEDYTLMLITKGDLLDQESKLARSGLGRYFQHVEIVSGKEPVVYQAVLDRYGLRPAEFVMIGNSLRSDVLPLLEIGAQAIHVPYYTTWAHEQVSEEEVGDRDFLRLDNIKQVLDHFETPVRHS